MSTRDEVWAQRTAITGKLHAAGLDLQKLHAHQALIEEWFAFAKQIASWREPDVTHDLRS